jgi:hypothetical protein
MSYIIRNQFGAFCSVCQSQLGLEEDDWDTCDACGGEGFESEDDFDYDYDEPQPIGDVVRPIVERAK